MADSRATRRELRVVYVAGTGRSGSTLLDRVLGEIPGVTSLNELARIWRDGFGADARCTCGQRFAACPFWSAVVARAFPDGLDAQRVERLQREVARTRHLLLAARRRAGRYGAAFAEYVDYLARLYDGVAAVAGTRIFIDSSKIPTGALALARVPGLQVHVVHLVRDPRAVAASWSRYKFDPAHGRALDRYRGSRSALRWLGRNLAAECLAACLPYTRLRYEDFVAAPRATVSRLLAETGWPWTREPSFEDERRIRLPVLHTIAGNPDRFESGETVIAPAAADRDRGSARSRFGVTLLAAPLLMRYGYALAS